MEGIETMQTPQYSDPNSPEVVAQQRQVAINTDQAGSLTVASGQETPSQWRQMGEQISSFLAELPEYLNEFFSEYQRPLITVGLVIGAFVTVKVTLAILDAINDVPLLAPIFELVGIGYSAWFVYRYLLQASTRKELTDELDSLRSQVLGRNSSNT